MKKYSVAFLMLIFAAASCKKTYLDVNQDPNRVTDDNVTAELIFPAAAEGVGSELIGIRASGAGAQGPQQFAQGWIGYMASNSAYALNPKETTYNVDFTSSNPIWISKYNVLFNLHQTIVKGLAQNDTVIAAAAMILYAKLYQDVVDLFGNVPYSQAFQDNLYTHPQFDKAQDIYADLQKKLDTAIQYMGLQGTKLFVGADIVNHGDQTKWIKLANTIKLRLLIRQSEISGFDPSGEIAKIFSGSGPGILGAGESVNENPGYANDQDKQSPFYANYGFTITGVVSAPSLNANSYIMGFLTNNSDPRVASFFATTSTGTYAGNPYGADPGTINGASDVSYFGPRLDSSSSQDQWIIPSYESLFFRAEAAARGWISDDPQTAYANAVTESFVWCNVPDAANAAASYMADNDIANWSKAGTSPGDRAKFIALQKYIANTCVDALESYADQRRLNFLPQGFISQNPGKLSNTLPLRLPYPQVEYTTNAANVQAEGTIDPFTTKLFWEP